MPANSEKEHLSIVICGHVDSGKSTTTGRLIFELGGLPERELDKLKQEAERLGKGSFAFAFYMDRQKEERERGVTIACTTKEFYTDKWHYTIIDAPGHRDFIKNMITGASQADVALIMVPADGNFTTAIAKGNHKAGEIQGQTRQHSRLINLLGVKQICIGVNKMDCDTAAYKQSRYDEIANEMKSMLVKVGWKKEFIDKNTPVVPISGWMGDNLLKKSDNMGWWKGQEIEYGKETIHIDTIYDVLDKLCRVPERPVSAPMRMPISGIYKIKGVGDVLAGRVEQGVVKPGEEVVFLPTHTASNPCTGKVFTVEMHHQRVDFANPGDNVGLNIKGLDKNNMPRSGDVMVYKKDTTLGQTREFDAQIQVLDIPNEIKVGYSPIGFVRCGRSACRISKLKWKMGKETGGKKMEDPHSLKSNEMAQCSFQPQQPLVCDTFKNCEGLSRVAFMDGNGVVMLGKVISCERKEDAAGRDLVNGVFLVNSGLTLVFMDVSRRMMQRPHIWRRYAYISYAFLIHYLLFQSMSLQRAHRMLEQCGIDAGSAPEGLEDEAYGILWSICGVIAYYLLSTDTSLSLIIIVLLTGPCLWLLQVLLLGSAVGAMKLIGLGFGYLLVCGTCFACSRHIEQAMRTSFLLSRVPTWETGKIRAWQNGLQRVLARHFDASDVIGLDLVVDEHSHLRTVLCSDPVVGDMSISSFGHTPGDQQRLQAFFTRSQNLIHEDPDTFHGPDTITATLTAGDQPIDFEIESVWMPCVRPCDGTPMSQPSGILWLGLRRFQAADGNVVEMEGGSDDVVDLDQPADASDGSSFTFHQESTSTFSESLPTTTRTGNVFAGMHKVAYSEEEGCKAELQERLQKVMEIGEAEGWLFGTKDLELVPEKVLGFGGYGVVVAAKLHGADVAVKLPKSADTGDRSVRHLISMANELRILRKLRHPMVVTFHGACIDARGCDLCLVSELVQGTQMDKFVFPPPMPPGETGRHKMIYDISCAMRYLHAQDPPIIHGDLKPANVMVERLVNGLRAKILDFGLSRVQTKHARPLGGTLQWKAPEVVLNAQSVPAPSADVFSFGLLTYFAVTGMKPFPGLSHTTVRNLRKKGRNMPRVWPTAVALIEECKALCSKCVRSEANARPSMQHIHGIISSWRPLPGSGIGPGQSAKPSWDEQVRQLRLWLSGQLPTPWEGDAEAAQPERFEAQQQRMLYPTLKETPAVSKRLALRSILAQWNVPFPDDCCCNFHAGLHEGLLVLQELQMECCSGNGQAMSGSQCSRCGLTGTCEGPAECKVCSWMASVNPQYTENAHQDVPQLTGGQAVMSL